MNGNQFKTHVTYIASSEKKTADDLPQACGWRGQDKILACYNAFDTLPDPSRNSKIQPTEKSFRLQCEHSLLPLFGASSELQITGESDSGFFPHTKYVVSLPTTPNSPNTHWV